MSQVVAKKDKLWLHIIITMVLMFGIGFIPAPAPITTTGMKLLGIFAGLIYGWSVSSLTWPSLMGMLALLLTGCIPFTDLLSMGFGNNTVIFLLFVFMFTAAIEQEGLTEFIANWCISRDILVGRPWIISFAILFGAMITGAFTNSFAAILIFWSVFSNICKQAGFKPFEKYPTMMILGIAIFSILGSCFLPYRTSPLVIMGTYASITGTKMELDFARFLLFVTPLIVLAIIVYLLVCRFVLRTNIGALKDIDMNFIDKSQLKMNKRQKIVSGFLAGFIALAILESVLPDSFFLGAMLSSLTTTGIAILLVMALLWVKVDGKPMVNINTLAQKGINWDMLLLFIVIFPLSDLMMAQDTGIRIFMVQTISPIFTDLSPLVFMVLALAIPAVLTNFANNVVVVLIFLQVICSVGASLGVNMLPMIMTLMFLGNIAFYTPAASAAAMVFGNNEWIKAKDIYTLGGLIMIILDVFIIAFGLFWGNIIY